MGWIVIKKTQIVSNAINRNTKEVQKLQNLIETMKKKLNLMKNIEPQLKNVEKELELITKSRKNLEELFK